MHELSLIHALLETIREQAAADHFSRVHRVALEVGALCCVEIAALEFCFDVVSEGTNAAGAALEITAIPAEGWCAGCGKSFSVSARLCQCPFCGAWDLAISGGDRIAIRELEVE